MEFLLLVVLALLGWRIHVVAREGKHLRQATEALEARLRVLEQGGAPPAAAAAAAAADEAVPVAAAPAEPSPPETAPVGAPPEPVETGPAAPVAAPVPPTPDDKGAGLEELLTVRWSVWLGAATLGLAGIFLVRYSIEQGLLGPEVRTALGLLIGAVLLAAAEWVRRREPAIALVPAHMHARVPAALAVGGLVTLFAAIYAAYQLYDLIGPGTAFAGLVAVAALGFGLSLLHGALLAVVGQVGAYLVPALVHSAEPSAWALFPYLLVVTAGVVALARYRDWTWTGWIAVAATAFWTLLWLALSFQTGDSLPIGLFLVAVALLFATVAAPARPDIALDPLTPLTAALAATPILLALVVGRSGYGVSALVLFAVLSAVVLARHRFSTSSLGLELLPPVLLALLALGWPMPLEIERPEPLGVIEGMVAGYAPAPVVPPSLERFIGWMAGFGLLFGGAGAGALWGARQPGRWASLGVAAPIVLLAIAYWKVTGLAVSLPWTAAALVLAALFLAMASRLVHYRGQGGLDAALAAYAVGVTAAIALGFTTVFRLGWLTVALAALLPCLAWINGRIPLPALRWLAIGVAAVSVARLLLNPLVADYALGSMPVLNGLLYVYGLPALAFFVAARMFARAARDLTVEVLEGGTIAFLMALATLQIRHATCGGTLDCGDSGLGEAAAQTIVWGTGGAILYWLDGRVASRVVGWGGRILTGIALLLLLFGNLILANPLFSGDPVGRLPLVNLLGLAYLVPALIALAFLMVARSRGDHAVATGAAVIALGLGLFYLSLEVRRAFSGPDLTAVRVRDAETYAYSAVWLAYGGLLLALGIWRHHQALRYASLAVIVLVIAKVFLLDMSALKGLWRALSFFGLGLALIGIGWLYQRFVFPARRRGGLPPPELSGR